MNKKIILGYINEDSVVTEEQAKILTHIHVAFGFLSREGEITANHHPFLKQISQIRKWNPDIKIILSVVRDSPESFTRCSASEELREKVARSCEKLIREEGFDGIDFDWEYPCVSTNGADCNPEDKYNYTLLCKKVKERIQGLQATLSIAAGADLFYVEAIEAKKMAEILDYVCLMTYDLKSNLHALTGHHTGLYSSTGDILRNSCDQALRLFEKAGFPKEKLLMGTAFYSRVWYDVPNRYHGFLQATKSGADYGPDYHDLVENYINKNGFVRYWDEEAKAPYLYDGHTFYSYDDEESIRCKCKYVKEEEFGGIFYWSHSSDKTGTLLSVMGKEMERRLP